MLTFTDLLQTLFSGQICASKMSYEMGRQVEAFLGEKRDRVRRDGLVSVEVTFEMPMDAFQNPMKYLSGNEQADKIIAAIVMAAPTIGED